MYVLQPSVSPMISPIYAATAALIPKVNWKIIIYIVKLIMCFGNGWLAYAL